VTITPAQCKAARLRLGGSVSRLAIRVSVSEKAIRDFESKEPSRPLDLGLVRERLESARVEFIPKNGGGAGARLRTGRP